MNKQLRLAVWYESSLGRNDGNPLYVTAYLKRLQYFVEMRKYGKANPKLLSYFPSIECKDKYAEGMVDYILDTFIFWN